MQINLIVLTSTHKSLNITKAVSHKFLNLFPMARLVVCVPEIDVDLFSVSLDPRIKIMGEDRFLEPDVLKSIKGLFQGRSGWYIQQFVKISAMNLLLKFGEIGLIWDGDTDFNNIPDFFSKDNKVLLGCTQEYHLPYFINLEQLLFLDKEIRESFICQYIVVKKEWIVSLLNDLQTSELTWQQNIIQSINFHENSGFSEYELIGTYVFKHFPEQVRLNKKLRVNRFGYSWFGTERNSLISFRRLLSLNYDLVAFEDWDHLEDKVSIIKLILLVTKDAFISNLPLVSKITLKNSYIKVKNLKSTPSHSTRNEADIFLAEFFSSKKDLLVIQVGANDGVQNDPLRRFIQLNLAHVDWILVEPLDFYIEKLKDLYRQSPRVSIIKAAVGKQPGLLKLFFLNPETASEMDGSGPKNQWAHGQGSSNKATIIYGIYNNSFRGSTYRKNIASYIDSIISATSTMIPISDLCESDRETLLVIDVQGYEFDVLLGIDTNKCPKYIMVEDEFHDNRISPYLSELGYTKIIGGHDPVFEYTVGEQILLE